MANKEEIEITEQAHRLQVIELALTSVTAGPELAKDANIGAEVIRVAKRYWKFVKNDPLAEKDEADKAE
jgi:hypothetical protein